MGYVTLFCSLTGLFSNTRTRKLLSLHQARIMKNFDLILMVGKFTLFCLLNIVWPQPCPQANSRYPNEKRKPGTEREFSPTSFTGDVTLKLAGTTGDETGMGYENAKTKERKWPRGRNGSIRIRLYSVVSEMATELFPLS